MWYLCTEMSEEDYSLRKFITTQKGFHDGILFCCMKIHLISWNGMSVPMPELLCSA